MGALGGMLGTSGGAGGTGFSGPSGYGIQAPVTPEQVNAANAGVGNSLASSNALLAALQGSGGVGNQSQAYNQGQTLYGQLAAQNGLGTQATATGQQGALNTGLASLNGIGTQGAAMAGQGALAGQLSRAGGIQAQQLGMLGLTDVYGQQGMTAQQLQGIANGTGPNPAQAMLNQQTGQNVANQAALMAGQRGAGANTGLLARQAAQQGAATQQQAVGQGATMQAQQQMAALQGLTAQQQAMAATSGQLAGVGAGLTAQQQAALQAQYGQGAGAVGQLQTGIGQQFGQGATTVGQQQGQLGMNAGIAQNQVGNTVQAAQNAVQGNIANAGQQMGALGNMNTAGVSQQSNINTANAGMAGTRMGNQGDMLGGLLGGAGAGGKAALSSAAGSAAAAPAAAAVGAGGGYVGMANGGVPPPQPMMAPMPGPVMQPPPGPQSSFGQFLGGGMNTFDFARTPLTPEANAAAPAQAETAKPEFKGSKLSQGAQNLGYMGAQSALGAAGGQARDFRGGGGVKASSPAEKATKPGNDYANDKVKAVLSEGEVVIPRSVMQSKDPASAAAQFVAKVMAKRGKK